MFFILEAKETEHRRLQDKGRCRFHHETHNVPKRVEQATKVAQPVKKTVSLAHPRDQVEAHLNLHAGILKPGAGVLLRWEVNPSARSCSAHMKVEEGILCLVTILDEPSLVFEQVRLDSPRRIAGFHLVDLLREEARAVSDRLFTILALIEDLLVHQDVYL